MARESTAPTDPITPGKPREQTNRPLPNQPEFGKPSPLRPTHPQNRSTSNPFNIPKQNRPRPEHHRSQQQQQQQQQNHQHQQRPEIRRPIPNPFKHDATQQNAPPHVASTPQQQQHRPEIRRPIPNPFHHNGNRPNIPPHVMSTPKRSEPFDPFKPVRPSAYNNNRMSRPVDNDVIEIRRPENLTFNTPRAPKTFYASKPSPIKQTNAAKNLQNFVDLTTPSGGGFSTSRSTFGVAGASEWVDTAKANENIKALLEGAFEDEDEKQPKSKGKRKKNKKDKSKKKTDSQETEKKVESLDMDDLAAQLQGVSVNETPGTDDDDDTHEVKAAVKDDTEETEAQDGNDKEDASESDAESEESEDEDDDGVVEGLNVTLLPHQRQGLKWMCEKEIGSRKGEKEVKGVLPKGGILADDMGLGKTVQAIALLLTNHKPKDGTRRRPNMFDYDQESEDSDEEGVESRKLPPGLSKSTLVVAPLALIKQWESEIRTKVEPAGKLRVLVYHGNARAKSTGDLDDYDVVITTYGTLTSEHNAAAKNDKKAGVFSVYWYRIILDEAHTIKNRNAKATQAAYALDAEYRWCLSGTPMQNNLDELQSLIRFLRIKPYNDLANWKDQITRPLANGRGGLAIERLQVVLKAFMKRRTKDVLKQNANSKPGDGKKGEKKDPGFHIVKREVIKVAAEFMPGERNFYERLEQRTENSLEKMMGDSKMDYAGALVLLLRLRQSCNHPDLVKSDLAKDKDILLQTGASNSQASAGKKNELDDVADLFGALSVVSKKCDICQMDLSQAESSGGGSRCSDCEKDFNTPFATDGAKKKAYKNIIDLTASPSVRRSQNRMERVRKNKRVVLDSDDEEEEDGDWLVPEDQRTGLSLGKAGGSDDEDAEGGGDWIGTEDSETDDEPESPSQRVVRQKSPVDDDSEDDIYLNPGDDENQVLPSSKIRHLMKILQREAPDYKFIVFSVFTSMLDKVEPFLKRAGIGYARYDGSMRNDLREASLEKLRNNRATRVLLCSLRAGALGLNLTAASRVVILEPFWNPAIDRVHRLNQTVDVKIYKMIIKDTVEERILDLQNRKRELANVTIEGKTAAAKLTMNDMMALFGKDAELRYTGDNQNRLDFSPQKGSLLNSNYESSSQTRSETGSDGSRDRKGKQEKRAGSTEHSVYGRRW
ncbi:SNF2 family N-terminal domain-containing protein [Aspergillus karnatakaensis]|uniref:putative SNF2 family helicase/ATPase n=1 Tax=Aspergillus karnatakaensis TaxID=1810916 RepID=UPI003CCDEDCC